MENRVAVITIWHGGKNVREGRATPIVHQDPDRVWELTWLAYRDRRADRHRGERGAGGTHCDLMSEDGAI
ncbi:hypothetical protein DSCW_19600 [Desulfosarcina widdelii]|uniref:Uncharacterized protein n=1 Tax=Desulfosarcina widdelii TaxID=947919 RepID=A0A5K7Z3J1_9BACT|nr:hypothetical protein DSCW_19600 [Desulfosarcina widdelii]